MTPEEALEILVRYARRANVDNDAHLSVQVASRVLALFVGEVVQQRQQQAQWAAQARAPQEPEKTKEG